MKKKLYLAETNNLRESKKSYTLLEKEIRDAIGRNDQSKLDRLLPFLCINAGMIIENTLYKIINSEETIQKTVTAVRSKNSLSDKWVTLVEESVKENYGKKIDMLDFSIQKKYTELVAFIKSNIEWIYEIRNKFAHGQIYVAMNNERTEINSSQTAKVRTLTYFDIKKVTVIFIKVLSDLILFTTKSPAAFDKHFDKYYKKFQQLETTWDNKNYSKYKNALTTRYNNRLKYIKK